MDARLSILGVSCWSFGAKYDKVGSKRDACFLNLHVDAKECSVAITLVPVLLDSK